MLKLVDSDSLTPKMVRRSKSAHAALTSDAHYFSEPEFDVSSSCTYHVISTCIPHLSVLVRTIYLHVYSTSLSLYAPSISTCKPHLSVPVHTPVPVRTPVSVRTPVPVLTPVSLFLVTPACTSVLHACFAACCKAFASLLGFVGADIPVVIYDACGLTAFSILLSLLYRDMCCSVISFACTCFDFS